MTTPSSLDAARAAGFTRFEVRDGMRRVGCNVSDEALEAVSGLTGPSTPALRRRSFDRFRTLINAAAMLKLRTLPLGFVGPIVLTSGDLRRVPPMTGEPPFGSSPRGLTRSATLKGGISAPSTTTLGNVWEEIR